MGFLQHLEQCQHQYRESDVLALLSKCLRGSAFAWFKDQTFIIIQDFGRGLACAFPTISLEFASKTLNQSSTTSASHSSPQYHSCVECSSHFSSMSRLLQHTQYHCTGTQVICKHCDADFNFKNKLHEHIREQHTQKSDIKSNLRSPTPESTYKVMEKSAVTRPSASLPPQEPPTPSATPRNLVTDTRIPLQPVSPKGSNLSIATPKIRSERVEKASIQQVACARICKLCKQSFNFNNKLHEHIRQHQVRKPVKSSDLPVFALESAYKTEEKSAVTCPLTSQFTQSTPPATPRNQISESETSFKTVTSSNRSDLTVATLKITSQSVGKLSPNCSLTSSLSSSRTPVRNLHESHIRKPHLIVDDLSRMFHGKSRPFGLRQHHNRRLSSQSLGIRQSHSSPPSVKPHLTIENLFEMFDGKSRRKSLFQSQNNVSFRVFSDQMRITAYFKSAVNQKLSISQDSESSKSKGLDQHMPAEFIRTNSSKCSEKSAFLSYKMSGISYIKPKIFLQSRFSSRFSFTWPPLTSSPSSRSPSPDLHLCCTCFGQFSSNNWLHKHLRASHQGHSSCQSMRVLN